MPPRWQAASRHRPARTPPPRRRPWPVSHRAAPEWCRDVTKVGRDDVTKVRRRVPNSVCVCVCDVTPRYGALKW